MHATYLAILAAVAGLVAAAPTDLAVRAASPNSLNAAFVAKGKKYFGQCADQNTLSDATAKSIITTDFGQVTPENSMVGCLRCYISRAWRLTILAEMGRHRAPTGQVLVLWRRLPGQLRCPE